MNCCEASQNLQLYIMSHAVRICLTVDEVLEVLTLILKVFLKDDCGYFFPPFSESSLLFRHHFLCLTFLSGVDGAKHDFAGMADEAEGSVI
ncbi:hypothetical protein DPMN_082526 [Dreissena polymorpha]|uniref:Uncharacterized protein n=1 Tax=Dreissena polymorpha TaxID=45954 RepID=A0A9D3Y7R2_DREPO|nr:hypothetical protein DPMN_082526 [Dreissena polymorpha]